MRENKFRALQREKKRWLDSVSIYSDGSWMGSMIENEGEISGYGEEECDLTFYTGLKDKNGKEIYEGDILVIDYGRGKTIGQVEWMDDISTYAIAKVDGGHSFSLQHSRRSDEVIGNIYENPELLTKK